MTAAQPRARDFAVTPPPAHAGMLLAALLALPAGVVLVAWIQQESGDPSQVAGLGAGLLGIGVVGVLTMVGLVRRRVTLEGGRLRVQAGLFTHTVGAGELDLDRARVIDLAERTELRPVVKTWGMSLPGYHAGHFRLRDKLGKAFCLVTDRERVLWLPHRDATTQLLLSVQQPRDLLEALKAARS